MGAAAALLDRVVRGPAVTDHIGAERLDARRGGPVEHADGHRGGDASRPGRQHRDGLSARYHAPRLLHIHAV